MIGWIDASSGASGDMLLGALVDVGVPIDVIQDAVQAVVADAVTLTPTPALRNGFAATHCHVGTTETTTTRTWADISAMLREADLAEKVHGMAHDTFERLAESEAKVHGMEPDDVAFHEVGALDAIADVVGVCAGLAHLGLDDVAVSAVAVGSGTFDSAHGRLTVPAPAVADLLRGHPSYSGPGSTELCTPTGAALLATQATSFGPQPPMTVQRIGVGAGARDPQTHANVLRLFVGDPAAGARSDVTVLETNVDDLDPRLWPNVIEALLRAGASDAWLTPIMMKKGRPAHTLSVLVAATRREPVRAEIFRQTSTIGLREVAVTKQALDRETRTVQVDGHRIRVKLAVHDGAVVNAQPEYDDVATVAARTERPVREVLAEAVAASRDLRR